MSDSDRVLDTAGAVLRRVSDDNRARQSRRRAQRRRRLAATSKRLALVTLAALLLLVGIGMVTPLGVGGVMLAGLALLIVWAVVLLASAEPEPRVADLAGADLAALPARTGRWLETQRPALPAPAIRLVDRIGLTLDALGPQLAMLDPREPAAAELRKLIAQELPELIDGYARVPAALRDGAPGSGLHPDRQLLDGLAVVDDALARMSEGLASGDLHRLATQGRYLELKYRGDLPD